MKSTELYALALVMLVASLCATPAIAQPQPVTCNTVIQTPGKYELVGDLSCEVGVPPPLFCDVAAITIAAPNVQLNGRGFTLSGINTGVGIRILSTGVDLQDIVVEAFNIGIEISGGGLHHLDHVTSRSNSGAHCGGGIGIQMTATSDNRLTDSTIVSNEEWGVRLIGSHKNRLIGNEISQNRFRPGTRSVNVELVSSNENTIIENDLSEGGLFGVVLDDSQRNRVEDNLVNDTAQAVGFGTAIRLVGSVENSLRGNSVDRTSSPPGSNFIGIQLGDGARRNLVRDNDVFHHTGSGISLSAGAAQNEVRGNHALDNTPFDGADENPGCDGNTWKGNEFGTVNQACVE